MLELRRADGVRGLAECFGLEQGGQAEAELQSRKHCLPCAVPYGGHEERAGQAGEEDQWGPKTADEGFCTSCADTPAVQAGISEAPEPR